MRHFRRVRATLRLTGRRIARSTSGPTRLALVAVVCLAVWSSYLGPMWPWFVVGVLSLVAAIGTASARSRR